MLKIDIGQIEKYGDTFFSSNDTAYLIFLVIGIVGYFTIPSVANYIIHAGGVNTLLYKTSNLFTGAGTTAMVAAGGAAAGMVADVYGDGKAKVSSGMASQGASGGYINEDKQANQGYMHDKLSGKS